MPRVDKPLRGLALQSPEISLDTLQDTGAAGGLLSTFSPRGPGPGQADALTANTRLEPAISGGQINDVELQVRRGGMPERQGLEMLWKLGSEGVDDEAWRQWTCPSFQTHWVAAVWDDTLPFETFDLIVTHDDQQVICIFIETTAGEPIQATRFEFDAAEPAWTTPVFASVDPYDSAGLPENVSDNAVAGAALPNGRILAMAEPTSGFSPYSMWASDDRGATWFRYAAPGDTGGVGFGAGINARWRLKYYRGDLIFLRETTTGRIDQFGSSTLGTTFEFVATELLLGSSISVDTLPQDAGVVVGYIDDATSFPSVRVLSGAFSPITDATAILVDSVLVDDMATAIDGVGNVWVFATLDATPNIVAVWVSEDAGLSFTRTENLFDTTDGSTFLRNFAAEFVRGWCCLAHNWTTDVETTTEDSIGTLWAGGWSNFGPNNPTGLPASVYETRHSWAESVINGYTGIPIELPSNTGWTFVGAGTETLEDPGELELGAVAQTALVRRDVGTSVKAVLFEMRFVSGTGSSTTDEVITRVASADGVTERNLVARWDDANNRIRLHDPNGPTDLGDIDIDPSEFVQLVMAVATNGEFITLFKRPWETRWTRGPAAFVGSPLLANGGPGLANSRVEFGNSGNTAVVRVRQWLNIDLFFNLSALGHGFAELEPGGILEFGGPVTTATRPIPEVGSETAAAFLSATRGPGRTSERFDVDTLYDFGIDRAFADISPSRNEPFRTEDALSEVVIAFDATTGTTLSDVWQWLFGFFGCNFKTAEIERAVIGLPWISVGTYNAATGFEGLTFAGVGNYIRPDAGTIAAGRPIRKNELVGGFAIFATGTRKILGNSPGVWRDPTGDPTLFPEIRLDSPPPTTSGSVDLVFPNGVLYVPHTGVQPAGHSRFWRVRIPVQPNPDGFVQIGVFFPAGVTVMGKQWSRGWSREMRPNTSRAVSRFGTIRKRFRGPPARRWSMNFGDGANEGKIRPGDPDYLAQPGVLPPGTPLAMRDDVWTLLYGLLEETGGGEANVVACAVVPAGEVSVNDRTLFVFGSWDSSVQANNVEGNEGVNEFNRIDPIAVTEQP